MQGLKHLITCRCILSQFLGMQDPLLHQFIVFSVIDDDDQVVVKHVTCNNCGVVHRVYDVCKSDIINNENVVQVSLDDIKSSLSEKYVQVLERYSCDLPTYEHVQYIIENSKWGEYVVLSTETLQDNEVGKVLRVIGSNMFKVEQFERKAVI